MYGIKLNHCYEVPSEDVAYSKCSPNPIFHCFSSQKESSSHRQESKAQRGNGTYKRCTASEQSVCAYFFPWSFLS
jgi:hypothetical protein